jgi:hypothetical protein
MKRNESIACTRREVGRQIPLVNKKLEGKLGISINLLSISRGTEKIGLYN